MAYSLFGISVICCHFLVVNYRTLMFLINLCDFSIFLTILHNSPPPLDDFPIKTIFGKSSKSGGEMCEMVQNIEKSH